MHALNAAWGPPGDSDEEAGAEDLIQEYGMPMDTSSDDPGDRAIAEQQAFEVEPTYSFLKHGKTAVVWHHTGAAIPLSDSKGRHSGSPRIPQVSPRGAYINEGT